MIYDVVVVGSGAGGASAANFLARQGISTLLLDKSSSHRDTVRSDGLMPQAIYWLDRLGCVDEVLAEARGCIKACELYVDGKRLLTGHFPKDTIYPNFAILIVRRRFDEIMLKNAIASGARFEGNTLVRGLRYEKDCVRVLAESDRKPVEFRGRIIIGADGTSSTISRAIGNTLKDGALGISVRTTYRDVKSDGAGIRVYFNGEYFPSYGWLFIDDHGTACVGLGRAIDKNFPIIDPLRVGLRRFIDTDLAETLADASRCGPFSGGISGYYRPNSIAADRVMLIGDAANQADPLNRGGIHTAMESAHCAAEACRYALSVGDFARETLTSYEDRWSSQFEPDWQISEIFMSLAKNPNLKDFSLFVLKQIGELATADPRFGNFASGVFSGVVSHSSWLSPRALFEACPKDLSTWLTLLKHDGGESGRGFATGSARFAYDALASASKAGLGLARSPGTTLDWGMDVVTKAIRLTDRQVRDGLSAQPINWSIKYNRGTTHTHESR
ncbi:MAG: NAD(P)/FAD-dependent oxidoreductase [Rhodobacteraceae bacterium]|nr:NAD(P)/FAD-dependent oxidoreductase [Paracoccaceae bacterium]